MVTSASQWFKYLCIGVWRRNPTGFDPDSFRAPAQALVQIDSRLFPVALHGALRHPPHRRDLREGKAAEELEVHHLRQLGLELGELVERVAHERKIYRVRRLIADIGVERRHLELATAFLRMAAARVVDDEAAHRPRRVGHEAAAVGKRDRVALRHVDERFVQQRRRTHRDRDAAFPELASGQPMQLGVEPLEESLARDRVALVRGGKERRQIGFHVVRPWVGKAGQNAPGMEKYRRCGVSKLPVSCQEIPGMTGRARPKRAFRGWASYRVALYGSEIAASSAGSAITATPSRISATPAAFAMIKPCFQVFSTKTSAKMPAIHSRFINPTSSSTVMIAQQQPRQSAPWINPARSAL